MDLRTVLTGGWALAVGERRTLPTRGDAHALEHARVPFRRASSQIEPYIPQIFRMRPAPLMIIGVLSYALQSSHTSAKTNYRRTL